jgi:hypothetical protein
LQLGSATTSFANLHFVVGLSGRTTRDGTKDGIGKAVNDFRNLVVALTWRQTRDDAEAKRKDLKAIRASNEADVVLIQTQMIMLTNDHGGRAHGQPGTGAGFEAHAGDGARALAHLTGLNAATPAVVSLAALVIAPSGTRLDVVERSMAHVDLSGAVTEHGSYAAGAGGTTGDLAKTLVEGFAATRELAEHGAMAT